MARRTTSTPAAAKRLTYVACPRGQATLVAGAEDASEEDLPLYRVPKPGAGRDLGTADPIEAEDNRRENEVLCLVEV